MDDASALCLPVQHFFYLTWLIHEVNQGAPVKHQLFTHHSARCCQRSHTVLLWSAPEVPVARLSQALWNSPHLCPQLEEPLFSFSVCIFLHGHGLCHVPPPLRTPLRSLFVLFLLHVHLALVFDELCCLDGCNLASVSGS